MQAIVSNRSARTSHPSGAEPGSQHRRDGLTAAEGLLDGPSRRHVVTPIGDRRQQEGARSAGSQLLGGLVAELPHRH